MKKLLAIILFTTLTVQVSAQCEKFINEQSLKKGMFVLAEQSSKIFVAEILSVSDNDFSCRFLHSNSVYEFVDLRKMSAASNSKMLATVKSNKGGSYIAGNIFSMNIYMRDPEACDVSTVTPDKPLDVIATFVADNKSYLGRIKKNDNGNGYTIKFPHSNSLYTLDNKFKVLTVTGGGYTKGNQLKIEHARILTF